MEKQNDPASSNRPKQSSTGKQIPSSSSLVAPLQQSPMGAEPPSVTMWNSLKAMRDELKGINDSVQQAKLLAVALAQEQGL